MGINNIQFIDQHLAHLRSLIPQCKAQSAAEKGLADTMITLEIKRIESICALEIRLGELRNLIPVYIARCPTYEQVLAKQIINFDLKLIAAKTTQLPTHPPAPHLFAPYPPAQLSPLLHLLEQHSPEPQHVQLKYMAGILTVRP